MAQYRPQDNPNHQDRYGWMKSPHDSRDYQALTPPGPIAEEVDPRGTADEPVIYDQGDLGSCTANATGRAFHMVRLQAKDFGWTEKTLPSRLFIYYCERQIEGNLNAGDCGAYGRDGFNALRRYGVCHASLWPYDVNKFDVRPAQGIWQYSAMHRMQEHFGGVPRSVLAWKAMLTAGRTIVMGFSVYESFESNSVATTGIVPNPSPSETILGGHCVQAVGFLKDYPAHCLFANSWGTNWAMKGYFLLPWDFIMKHRDADGSILVQ